MRNYFPRFDASSLQSNLELVNGLAGIAVPLGLSVGQLALAWLLTVAPDVVPLPGPRRPDPLVQNVAAAGVRLDTATMQALEAAVPATAIAGSRLAPADADVELF